MIMGSGHEKPLEIGKRYIGLTNADGQEFPDQPFVVLRTSSYEEWLQQGRELRGYDPVPGCDLEKARFYEVSLD